MARPQAGLYAGLQNLFNSRVQVNDATAAAVGGASSSGTGGNLMEVAVTPEELPAELKDALSRTLALVAGTTNARDTRRILQDHYAMFAVYETNLLWCPHSISIAAWMGAARALTMPYVEGIRCHRIVLRRVPAAAFVAAGGVPRAAASQTSEGLGGPVAAAVTQEQQLQQGMFSLGTSPEAFMQMQMDVTFAWRPLAPLHHLLTSWGATGLQLPTFTTEHTITLTVNAYSRVVLHRDITHNFPSAPLPLKGVLGLPTPLVATLLHV